MASAVLTAAPTSQHRSRSITTGNPRTAAASCASAALNQPFRTRRQHPLPQRIASPHFRSPFTSTRRRTHPTTLRAHKNPESLNRLRRRMHWCDGAPAEMCMRLLVLTITVLVCFPPATFGAQNQTATVRVQVRASEKPVEDAEVVVAGTSHRTDAAGTTTIIIVPGTVEITVLKSGFAPTTASVQVAGGADSRRGRGVTGPTDRRRDRHGRGVHSHGQEARGSADAGRSPGSGRDRGEDAHDAR